MKLFFKTIISGFAFGMLLQLAVGPVCIYVFNYALTDGFLTSLAAVAGVTLVDALFIILAISGIGAVFTKKHSRIFGYTGGAVIFIFGVYTVYSSLYNEYSPVAAASAGSLSKPFFTAVVLTASCPLTIVFWTGVFSVKLSDKFVTRFSMLVFGAGALSSTILFLTFISFCAEGARSFLTVPVIRVLNLSIGVLLMLLPAYKIITVRKKNTV